MKNLSFFRRLNRYISKIPIFLSEIKDETVLEKPLIQHILKHPNLRWIDIYKFLMQGSCGWGHLLDIKNEKGIKEYLHKETNRAVKPLVNEDLLEIIDEQTTLCRVNLRVWKKTMGEDTDMLWTLMQQANENVPTGTELFLHRWIELIELYERGVIVINQKRKRKYGRVFHWLNFVLELISQTPLSSDIPLVSHSSKYRRHYKPSYRIVKKRGCSKDI